MGGAGRGRTGWVGTSGRNGGNHAPGRGADAAGLADKAGTVKGSTQRQHGAGRPGTAPRQAAETASRHSVSARSPARPFCARLLTRPARPTSAGRTLPSPRQGALQHGNRSAVGGALASSAMAPACRSLPKRPSPGALPGSGASLFGLSAAGTGSVPSPRAAGLPCQQPARPAEDTDLPLRTHRAPHVRAVRRRRNASGRDAPAGGPGVPVSFAKRAGAVAGHDTDPGCVVRARPCRNGVGQCACRPAPDRSGACAAPARRRSPRIPSR